MYRYPLFLVLGLILLPIAAISATEAIPKEILAEGQGLGISIVDSKKAGDLQARSVYFENKEGPVQRAFLRLSGTFAGKPIADEIDAKDLPASEKCPTPCKTLSEEARKSFSCSGECSYGAPLFLLSDEQDRVIFFSIENQVGRGAMMTVFAYRPEDKKMQTLGNYYAGYPEFSAHYDRAKKMLTLNYGKDSKNPAPENLALKKW